jgi:hypothetical protein
MGYINISTSFNLQTMVTCPKFSYELSIFKVFFLYQILFQNNIMFVIAYKRLLINEYRFLIYHSVVNLNNGIKTFKTRSHLSITLKLG